MPTKTEYEFWADRALVEFSPELLTLGHHTVQVLQTVFALVMAFETISIVWPCRPARHDWRNIRTERGQTAALAPLLVESVLHS